MNKLRTNDEVIILAGKDKGKRGKILRVFPDDRILVSGIRKLASLVESLRKRLQYTFPMPRSSMRHWGRLIELDSGILKMARRFASSSQAMK